MDIHETQAAVHLAADEPGYVGLEPAHAGQL
jgi:hypothetical protein